MKQKTQENANFNKGAIFNINYNNINKDWILYYNSVKITHKKLQITTKKLYLILIKILFLKTG